MLGGLDNFRLIRGIGPATERRLHEAGVHTFERLAALSPAELAVLLGDSAGPSIATISRQDWIGQARELMAASMAAGDDDRAAEPGGQPYATFLVELLLDPGEDVRRTRILHLQSKAEDAWAGWQIARLVEFVAGHALLPGGPGERSWPDPGVQERASVRTDKVENATRGHARPEPLGPVRVRELVATGLDAKAVVMLAHGQPFDVRLVLDLSDVKTPAGLVLAYSAAVYARSLDGRLSYLVGQIAGTARAGDRPLVIVQGQPLPRTLYRLEAGVTLTIEQQTPGISVLLEGSLLQIY